MPIMDNWSHEVMRTMSGEIVKKLAPEEEELLLKREELASVRAALAERELELADLRAQLKGFRRPLDLRQVGVLYSELDDWEAKIAEIEASLKPSETARQKSPGDTQAEETHEATHGEASKARDFQPSTDLKSLFRRKPQSEFIPISPRMRQSGSPVPARWLRQTRPTVKGMPMLSSESLMSSRTPLNLCRGKASGPSWFALSARFIRRRKT